MLVALTWRDHCVTRPKFWPIPRPRLFIRDTFCRYQYRYFFSETKFSKTDTETYFPRPNFPRPIPRLYFRDQILRYRYGDFFSETKFFDTNTETSFPRPNFAMPIPRLFIRDKFCRYQYQYRYQKCTTPQCGIYVGNNWSYVGWSHILMWDDPTFFNYHFGCWNIWRKKCLKLERGRLRRSFPPPPHHHH